jgi:hypothetical protein
MGVVESLGYIYSEDVGVQLKWFCIKFDQILSSD